jgi:chemotaxis protein methyltransferase CheR
MWIKVTISQRQEHAHPSSKGQVWSRMCARAGLMVADQACIAFLKSYLPELQLRWTGYRKVRRLVGKRLNRRLGELGLADLDAYGALLRRDAGERARFEAMCRIPISRFYRDRRVFDVICQQVLPQAVDAAIARGDSALRCWSAGCASGEEPYTLSLLWRLGAEADRPSLDVAIVATDVDETMLRRAAAACYARSSLKDVPAPWLARAFAPSGNLLCLRPEFRQGVRFLLQDIRSAMPDGPFDIILCRNLVFTYFDDALQRRLLDQIYERLLPRGCLVLGAHERLPTDGVDLAAIGRGLPIYRRGTSGAQELGDW